METKPSFLRIYIKQQTKYDGATTSVKQPGRNMTIMGKVDTSNLMMLNHVATPANLGPLLLTWINFNSSMNK